MPDALDDAALEARLFTRPADAAHRGDQAVPVWAQLHQELKRPGVTLQLLWIEYRSAHPTGYAYSHFLRPLSPLGAGAQGPGPNYFGPARSCHRQDGKSYPANKKHAIDRLAPQSKPP